MVSRGGSTEPQLAQPILLQLFFRIRQSYTENTLVANDISSIFNVSQVLQLTHFHNPT